MERFTFSPDGVNQVASETLTVFTNHSDNPLVLSAKDYGFRYTALLVFDRTGLLCEIGSNLVANTDTVKGSVQDAVTIPPRGFLAAFGNSADANLFHCFQTVMEDAVLYNATMAPDHVLYGKYDENLNELILEMPEDQRSSENAVRFLFVGNSTTYYVGCPLKFRALCRAAGITVSTRYCTFGSAYLHEFANPEHERGKKMRELLQKESYDYVVLQDAGNVTLQDAAESLRVILPLIEKNGAKPLLYMRYASVADPTASKKPAAKTAEMYRDLSQLFRIPASPVCTAFEICKERYPEIDLFAGDRAHHNANGSYLAACTWLGTFFGRKSVGNPYTAFLEEDVCKKLQECADEANRLERMQPSYRYAVAAAGKEAGSLKETQDLSRIAAEEGAVLLMNDGCLPLRENARVALYGRMQTAYIKSGTGSGGKVNAPFVTNIRDSLKKEKIELDREVEAEYDAWIAEHPIDAGNGWFVPWNQEEMELNEESVRKAAERNDTAVMIIGRTAGEDRDCTSKPGSYYLSETEEKDLRLLASAFRHVAVILNIGNQMDLSWVENIRVSAVLCVWQGGMMGGDACANLLTGKVSPSGKLADTIARNLDDYPSAKCFGNPDRNEYTEDIYVGYRYFETFAKDSVLFPFGFGLSYTSFRTEPAGCFFDGQNLSVTAKVTNTGLCPGKEVVQVYLEAPQGNVGNPARRLLAFRKTGTLRPGESETVCLHAYAREMACYDEERHCWLLEAGTYRVYQGNNVRDAYEIYSFDTPERIVQNCSQLFAPEKPFLRLTQDGIRLCKGKEYADTDSESVTSGKKATGDIGIRLSDVADGKASMDDFLAQIPDCQLIYMVRGEGMNSPKAIVGTAGVFGGVTTELLHYGIPLMVATDGPSGVRLSGDVTPVTMEDGSVRYKGPIATALPNGTLLACTWNTTLMEKLFFLEGIENRLYQIDTLLGPGINIHRNPLCGRNFEYFSECPVLTGKIAAAILRGLDSAGACGTVKHFFGNSQETNRYGCDAVMSERAAREIYLKAFEIVVREGNCRSIMTSYNPVNGCWSASNPDLTRTLLRGEWGFDGIVMTDWWARVNGDEPGTWNTTSLHRMVIAQNDIYMPTPDATTRADDLEEALKDGRLTREDLLACAEHICRFAMHTNAFRRLRSGEKPASETVQSTEGYEEFLQMEKTRPNEITEFNSLSGEYIVEMVLKVQGDALAQNDLTLRIDSAAAVCVSVAPSDEEQTVLRAFTMISGPRKMGLVYDENAIHVISVRLFRK